MHRSEGYDCPSAGGALHAVLDGSELYPSFYSLSHTSSSPLHQLSQELARRSLASHGQKPSCLKGTARELHAHLQAESLRSQPASLLSYQPSPGSATSTLQQMQKQL